MKNYLSVSIFLRTAFIKGVTVVTEKTFSLNFIYVLDGIIISNWIKAIMSLLFHTYDNKSSFSRLTWFALILKQSRSYFSL